MSEFRSLPQNFSGSQDDELLLVTPTTSTRASLKSLFWDNYALLKLVIPGDQQYGIGTPNTWVKIPYNTLELEATAPWIQLNADGSFILDAGRYVIAPSQQVRRVDFGRLAIYKGNTVLAAAVTFIANADRSGSLIDLRKKLNLENQETLSVQISVSQDFDSALKTGDPFLAGIQVDAGVCEIFKLG